MTLKFADNQKGLVPLLIIVAVFGVIIFLIIATTLPFRNALLSSLFPKGLSFASATSKGVLRSMFARASQKAEEMGLPLLVSEQSQDEGGIEKETQLAEGYKTKKVDYSLVSKSSRAPKVYVDSAGGVSSSGEFVIKDLMEVQKAA